MNFYHKAITMALLKARRLFLIMKLVIIIMIVTLTQVSAKGYGQRITIKEQNITIEAVLKIIQKQSGYHFLYDKLEFYDPSRVLKALC